MNTAIVVCSLWIGDTVSELGSALSMFAFPLIAYALSGSAITSALVEAAYLGGLCATLLPADRRTLDEVATKMRAHPEITTLLIEGHTDHYGTDAYNLALSQRRVNATVAHLIAHGIAAERLEGHAYGLRRPAVPITRPGAANQNRRVVFLVPLDASPPAPPPARPPPPQDPAAPPPTPSPAAKPPAAKSPAAPLPAARLPAAKPPATRPPAPAQKGPPPPAAPAPTAEDAAEPQIPPPPAERELPANW